MMDAERMVDRLKDLPPTLTDPMDRFEQIGERVRRRRRQQTVVGGVAGAAVLALTVPLATQLLPDESAIAPGSATTVESPAPERPPWSSASRPRSRRAWTSCSTVSAPALLSIQMVQG